MDFTGRGIFTAASSWAWARGPAGAMATAGAVIALAMAAAEVIVAVAGPWPIAAIMLMAVVARFGETRRLPMQAVRAPAYLMPRQFAQARHMPALLTRHLRTPVLHALLIRAAAAAVDMQVAAVDMQVAAVDAANQ